MFHRERFPAEFAVAVQRHMLQTGLHHLLYRHSDAVGFVQVIAPDFVHYALRQVKPQYGKAFVG